MDLGPRPVQEDGPDQQRGLHPGRPGRQVRHRRRARDGRGLPHLPARQPRLRPRLRGHERHGRRGRRRAAAGCCSPRGSTASARRSTTTPSGVDSTTCRCPPPGPRWSGPSTRGWPSTRGGCSRRWRSSPVAGSTRWPSSAAGPTPTQWAQIHADVLGREIRQVADPVLANVRGAALITLVALGRLSRRRDPRPWSRSGGPSRPDRPTAAEYDVLFREFVAALQADQGHLQAAEPVLDSTGAEPGRPISRR